MNKLLVALFLLVFSCYTQANEPSNLISWGSNSNGQVPQAVTGSWKTVAAGGEHTCAINNNGQLSCWGKNDDEQAPEEITGTWKTVVAGGKHTCAIRDDDSLSCWGDNFYGCLLYTSDAADE